MGPRVRFALAILALAGAGLAGVIAFAPFDREARLRRLDLEALRRAALARPNDAELFLMLGRRLRQRGDLHRAFVVTRHACDLNHHAPKFVAAMAGALVDDADYDPAYRLAKDAMTRWPQSGEVRAQLSRVYAGRGYFTDALREAETAVRLAPPCAEAWQSLGNARSLNKRPEQAYAAFERALALEPRDAELLADYGEALARYGRPAEAEATLRRALALAPHAARPLGLLGQFEASRARTAADRAAARELLERARARAPEDAGLQYNLALLDRRDGRDQEAILLLKSCLTQDPRYGEAYLALGQIYQNTGRRAAARQAFAAWQRFSDYRREAAHLQMRLRRLPGNPELLRRLARLNAAHGKPQQAAEYQRQIQSPEPGAPANAGAPTSSGGAR
jgi:Flp pilus assembly protein TadD